MGRWLWPGAGRRISPGKARGSGLAPDTTAGCSWASTQGSGKARPGWTRAAAPKGARGGLTAGIAGLSELSAAKAATEQDWHEEYLAPVLAIRVVDGLEQAIEHIDTYSSRHTDSIVTQDHGRAMRFLREVDSSSVMVNASTRLADGFEYGLGAEVGISTDKLHARGPVGLEGLTSQKFVVLGEGQIRT